MKKKVRIYRFIASLLCIVYFHSITAGFLAGTLVKIESSQSSHIPIEQLTLRTRITCCNVVTQEIKTQPVTRILKQKVVCYKRINIGTTSIDTSFGQLFYLPLKQTWVACQYLKVGDTLLTHNNTYVVIDTIEQINEEADIYEISVFDHRNFYVSDQAILVHNFGMVAGVALWYGGGFELSVYGAVTACGLIIGGVAALCKGRTGQSKNQEQKLIPQESNDCHIQPILGYQPSYSDTPINLLPSDATNVQNNHPRDCFNRPADCSTSLTMQSESCADDAMLLMGKNNNHKKPKQENNSPFPASGNPDDDDPRNNNNFYKKNSSHEDNSTQHPYGKYEDAPYHHHNSNGGNGKGAKSPAPIDGQGALDNSVEVNEISKRRIGISAGQIVELKYTSPGHYHGFILQWDQLDKDQKRFLNKNIKEGKIKGSLPKN